MSFKLFYIAIIVVIIIISQLGESYAYQEKGVKNYGKSDLKINTLVH